MSRKRKNKSEFTDAAAPLIYREIHSIHAPLFRAWNVHDFHQSPYAEQNKIKPVPNPIYREPVQNFILSQIATRKYQEVSNQPIPDITGVVLPLFGTQEWIKFIEKIRQFADPIQDVSPALLYDFKKEMIDWGDANYTDEQQNEAFQKRVNDGITAIYNRPRNPTFSVFRDQYMLPFVKTIDEWVRANPPAPMVKNEYGDSVKMKPKPKLESITSNVPITVKTESITSTKSESSVPIDAIATKNSQKFVTNHIIKKLIADEERILDEFKQQFSEETVFTLLMINLRSQLNIVQKWTSIESIDRSTGDLYFKIAAKIRFIADHNMVIPPNGYSAVAETKSQRLSSLHDKSILLETGTPTEFVTFDQNFAYLSSDLNHYLPVVIYRTQVMKMTMLQLVNRVQSQLKSVLLTQSMKLVFDYLTLQVQNFFGDMVNSVLRNVEPGGSVNISSTRPLINIDDLDKWIFSFKKTLNLKIPTISYADFSYLKANEVTLSMLASPSSQSVINSNYENMKKWFNHTCGSIWKNSLLLEESFRVTHRAKAQDHYHGSHEDLRVAAWMMANGISILSSLDDLLDYSKELHNLSSSLTHFPLVFGKTEEKVSITTLNGVDERLLMIKPGKGSIFIPSSYFAGTNFSDHLNPITYAIYSALLNEQARSSWFQLSSFILYSIILQYYSSLLFACAEMTVHYFGNMIYEIVNNSPASFSEKVGMDDGDSVIYVNPQDETNDGLLKRKDYLTIADLYHDIFLTSGPEGTGFDRLGTPNYIGDVYNSVGGYKLGYSTLNDSVSVGIWELFRLCLRLNIYNVTRVYRRAVEHRTDQNAVTSPLCVKAALEIMFTAIFPILHVSGNPNFLGNFMNSAANSSTFTVPRHYSRNANFFIFFRDFWAEDNAYLYPTSPQISRKINETFLRQLNLMKQWDELSSPDGISVKSVVEKDIYSSVLSRPWLSDLTSYVKKYNASRFLMQNAIKSANMNKTPPLLTDTVIKDITSAVVPIESNQIFTKLENQFVTPVPKMVFEAKFK